MLRAMPSSKPTWGSLMNSMRKRIPKHPTRNAPKKNPRGMRSSFFQYIPMRNRPRTRYEPASYNCVGCLGSVSPLRSKMKPQGRDVTSP